MKACDGRRCPSGGRGDQTDRAAGEQREVLRVEEQGCSHNVGSSSCVGKYQVSSSIQ